MSTGHGFVLLFLLLNELINIIFNFCSNVYEYKGVLTPNRLRNASLQPVLSSGGGLCHRRCPGHVPVLTFLALSPTQQQGGATIPPPPPPRKEKGRKREEMGVVHVSLTGVDTACSFYLKQLESLL